MRFSPQIPPMSFAMLQKLFARKSPADRRAHRRVYDRPIAVRLEDKAYKTLDWSLGGFRINGYHRELAVGVRLAGTIGPVNGARAGECLVEVVRLTDNGDVGLKFIEISPKVFVAMAGLKSN